MIAIKSKELQKNSESKSTGNGAEGLTVKKQYQNKKSSKKNSSVGFKKWDKKPADNSNEAETKEMFPLS